MCADSNEARASPSNNKVPVGERHILPSQNESPHLSPQVYAQQLHTPQLSEEDRARLAGLRLVQQQQQRQPQMPTQRVQRPHPQDQPHVSLERALADVYQRMRIFDPSLRYQGTQKREGLRELVASTAINVPWQPWRLAQTLIQLGYEPVPPQRKFSYMFQTHMYYYPNLVGYCKAIYEKEGWGGLFLGTRHVALLNFTGMSANTLIRPFVCSQVNKHLMPFWENGDVPDTEPSDSITSILIRGSRMFVSSMITSIAVELLVHPFKVIAIRCMSQTVGHETAYNGIWSSFNEIYRTEGIGGFYAGLIPALLGHVCTITIHSTLWLLFEIIAANISSQMGQIMVKLVSVPFLTFFPVSYAYPFFNVSTHMMVNNAGLAAGRPPFSQVHHGWIDCFRHLKAQNRLYWGSSIIGSRFAYIKQKAL